MLVEAGGSGQPAEADDPVPQLNIFAEPDADALAAAEAGAQFFEGSISGIGGGIRMPYGMAPYGNVASEDLVHMFNSCGVDTGLDTEKVVDAARRIKELLEIEQTHSYALAGAVKRVVLAQGAGRE